MKSILAVFMPLLIPLVTYAQYQCQGNQNTANCPPCYYNTTHIPNYHGTTADGRQILNVYIRTGNQPGNFDNPPGSGTTANNIWNAVFGCSGCPPSGTEMWNNATDTTSQPGTTRRPPYFFENNQTGGEISADIIIISDPSVAFATSDHASYPVKIFINPTWAATLSAAELAAIVAHEMGHGGGLGNAYKIGSGCENSTSIMQGLDAAGKPIVQNIQDRDVFQMNKYKNNQAACCANVWDDNATGPGGGDPGSGGGGGGTNGCSTTYGFGCQSANYGYPTGCSSGMVHPYGDPSCCCYWSPIVIDVDGNGFSLSDAYNGVLFDAGSSGYPVQVAWTTAGSDDAWLVLDRNGNGRVDNSAELFGNFTQQPPSTEANGFLALAVFDVAAQGGNNDGVIDSRDAIYSSLRLWQDVNHNGISEPSELHTLASLDVAAIELSYRESKQTDRYGNQFRYRAKVRDSRGARVGRWAWDVFPVVNSPP